MKFTNLLICFVLLCGVFVLNTGTVNADLYNGLTALMIGLPVTNTIIPLLKTLFDSPIIGTIAWLVIYIGIIYLILIRPIWELVEPKEVKT